MTEATPVLEPAPTLESAFIGQTVKEMFTTTEEGQEYMHLVLASGVYLRFALNETVQIGLPDLTASSNQLPLIVH